MSTMNREIALKWVERLESLPPETQGQGNLNFENKLCCLGVLCEIAAEAGIVDRFDDGNGHIRYDSSTYYLPESVAEWAEIVSSPAPYSDMHTGPKYNPIVGEHTVGVWNDQERKTFVEIAAMLREEFDLPK